MIRKHTLLITMVIFAILWAWPYLWVLSLSLRPNEALQASTAGIVPLPFTLDNYGAIIRNVTGAGAGRWFVNSSIVAVGTTLITLVLASLGGYAFARMKFVGKAFVLPFVLAGMLIPEQSVFIPQFTYFADWGLHNSHVGLMAPRLAVPIGVYLMTQFFRAVPRELEEAALIDNASHWKIFWKIMIPLSRPALTTLAIFTFLFSWNDFLWPLVSATKNEMYTLTVGLATMQSNFAQAESIGQIMASAVFASLPVIIVFVIFQKHIVNGIAMQAGK